MEIHLTPDHEAFLNGSISSGRFASTDDALREALDLLSDQERDATAIRAFVKEGLDDFEAGDFEEYTDAKLGTLSDGVRERGLAALARNRF